jgi:hypothetical protein
VRERRVCEREETEKDRENLYENITQVIGIPRACVRGVHRGVGMRTRGVVL